MFGEELGEMTLLESAGGKGVMLRRRTSSGGGGSMGATEHL